MTFTSLISIHTSMYSKVRGGGKLHTKMYLCSIYLQRKGPLIPAHPVRTPTHSREQATADPAGRPRIACIRGTEKKPTPAGLKPDRRQFQVALATFDSDFYRPKSNMSKRSPIAGMFSGTHGFSKSITGFGRLSRLRLEIVPRRQLRSMNFKTDA
jgi:hypothetical protein